MKITCVKWFLHRNVIYKMFISEHGIFICIVHISDDNNNSDVLAWCTHMRTSRLTCSLWGASNCICAVNDTIYYCGIAAPRHRYCSKHSRCIFVVVQSMRAWCHPQNYSDAFRLCTLPRMHILLQSRVLSTARYMTRWSGLGIFDRNRMHYTYTEIFRSIYIFF